MNFLFEFIFFIIDGGYRRVIIQPGFCYIFAIKHGSYVTRRENRLKSEKHWLPYQIFITHCTSLSINAARLTGLCAYNDFYVASHAVFTEIKWSVTDKCYTSRYIAVIRTNTRSNYPEASCPVIHQPVSMVKPRQHKPCRHLSI